MVQLYTVASDIQIWRTVDNSSDFSENMYSTTKVYQLFSFYHSYNYLDLSAAAAKNKLTVEVKYHVIQGLTVTV